MMIIYFDLFSHELHLTKSRLLKLFDHELVLKIWDSKEHCSARTKFDKPKPFKFSKQGFYTPFKRLIFFNNKDFLNDRMLILL